MVKCKYCGLELKEMIKYNLCLNPKCYFYYVPRFKYKEDKSVVPIKPKTRMQNVKETAVGIFRDIKTEMGNTLSETKQTINNQGVGYNQESDVFDTQFGRMDAGGL